MTTFLIATVAVTVAGALLLGSMFRRDDTRLGMAGLATLIGADLMAMIYAALDKAG